MEFDFCLMNVKVLSLFFSRGSAFFFLFIWILLLVFLYVLLLGQHIQLHEGGEIYNEVTWQSFGNGQAGGGGNEV
jgi:hypothetical protein